MSAAAKKTKSARTRVNVRGPIQRAKVKSAKVTRTKVARAKAGSPLRGVRSKEKLKLSGQKIKNGRLGEASLPQKSSAANSARRYVANKKNAGINENGEIKAGGGIELEITPFPKKIDRESLPDARGHFGVYGGMYVPETLMTPLLDLERAYRIAKDDPGFQKELADLLKNYAGRPTGLYFAERLTARLGGAKIYLKREDGLHTGAHKINNVLGQALLARRMGKGRVIAETGAGQHGTATAAVAAKFGLECVIYMGAEDARRQALNVFRMKLMGAEVREVHAGQKTLKEAVNEAMRDWVTNVRTTHYILGTAYGAHPYPMMVRDFHRVIGREARAQMLAAEGRLPDEAVACVGGGSNAIGLFFEFLEEKNVKLTGVEAGGRGITPGEHAARFAGGRLGVLQGCMTYLLQNKDGQILGTHSVSAGLDYAAVGPEHAYYREAGRIDYAYATDAEVMEAFEILCRTEGIIPALESTHAVAYAIKRAPQMRPDQILLVNLSGRGDKDVQEVARLKQVL